MKTYRHELHGCDAFPLDVAEWLIDEATAAARRHRAKPIERPEPTRRLALRPGPDTPFWNELVRQVRPHLRRRGSKAQLARLLGVPRQRLQATLKARYACLDAERTLMLLGWLGFFQRGGELVPTIRQGRPRLRAAAPARKR